MTRSFSFFEGSGAGAHGAQGGSSGGGGGGGATTTGGGAGCRGPGQAHPAVQTNAMIKHIGKMIFLFIKITSSG